MKHDAFLSPEAAAHALRSVSLPDVAMVEDLARMLGKSTCSIRAHLRAGNLPGRKLGNRWYVPRDALLSWLATRASETPPESNRPSSRKIPRKALRLIRGKERLSRKEVE